MAGLLGLISLRAEVGPPSILMSYFSALGLSGMASWLVGGLPMVVQKGLGTEITNLVRNPGANGVATDMGSLRDAFGAAIEAFS